MTYSGRVEGGAVVPLANPGALAAKLSRFQKGSFVTVTVDDEKTRTTEQNARYWKLIVPAFAEYAGNEVFSKHAELAGTTPKDSAHNVLKALLLGTFEVELPDGTTVTVERSTKSLTVAEFADYQDRAERFLNSQGIYLPANEEAA